MQERCIKCRWQAIYIFVFVRREQRIPVLDAILYPRFIWILIIFQFLYHPLKILILLQFLLSFGFQVLLTRLHSLYLVQIRVFQRWKYLHQIIRIAESLWRLTVFVLVDFLKLLINLQLLFQALRRLIDALVPQSLNRLPLIFLSFLLLDEEAHLFIFLSLLHYILLFLISYAKIELI